MIRRFFGIGRGTNEPVSRNKRRYPRYSIPDLVVILKKPYISGVLENISKGGILVRVPATRETFLTKTFLSVRKGQTIFLVDVAVKFVRTQTIRIKDKEYFLIGFEFIELSNTQKTKLDELFDEIDKIGVDAWSRK